MGTSVYCEMAEKNVYEVKRILNKRNIKGYVEYFIRWRGFSSKWDTWEPANNLSNCKNLMSAFEEKHALLSQKKEIRRYALKLVRKSKSLPKLDGITNKNKLARNKPLHANKYKEMLHGDTCHKKLKNSMQTGKASGPKSSGKDTHNIQTPTHNSHDAKKEKEVQKFKNLKKSFSAEKSTKKAVPIILNKKQSLTSNLKCDNKNKKQRTSVSSDSTDQKYQNLQMVLDQVARGIIGNCSTDLSKYACKKRKSIGDHSRRVGDNSKSVISLKKQSENKTKDVAKTNAKRKLGEVDANDSDSDEDNILYSVNDAWSGNNKAKQVKLSNDAESGCKELTAGAKRKKSVPNTNGRKEECTTIESSKCKPVKRISVDIPESQRVMKKPQNKLSIMGERKAKDPSNSVVHPTTPMSLYTSVKSVNPVCGQQSSSSLQPTPSPSMMDAYFGDLSSLTMRPSVMPLSPTTMSYKALLDNLPRQLHLKTGKSKRHADDADEVVERRVSVRATECAFRYKDIVVKKCQGYTQIWLNTHTSQKNAINPQVVQEIVSALNSAKYDDSKLVMFSSIGNVFCSGVDLHFLRSADCKVTARQMADAVRDLTKTFITFPKPVVATVTGAAIGLGLALLPLCDVVYASDKALFHLPYTQLCQTPEGCISYTLPNAVGPAMSSELLFAGRKLTALEAHQLGLVSQVFWPTSLMQEVIPRVQYMAMHSTKAMEATKLLIRSHQRTKLELTNYTECNLLLERWSNGECHKAIDVYLNDDRNILS